MKDGNRGPKSWYYECEDEPRGSTSLPLVTMQTKFQNLQPPLLLFTAIYIKFIIHTNIANQNLRWSSKMKRQRSVNSRKASAERTTVTTKKKAKAPAVEEAKEAAEKVAEEWKEGCVPTAEEVAEWTGLWSGVEEEMPWASSWIPFWETEANYDALYGDVLWDFDIWDLKAYGNAPNP